MRALRSTVIGVFCLLTGCVAYGPQAGGYGYGAGYSYVPTYPTYIAPATTIIVPIARAPRYRPFGHHRWRG
jgi:hypothetical protein